MKNIILTTHLLPTEDASQIAFRDGILKYESKHTIQFVKGNRSNPQHLYLCSNREPKNGDVRQITHDDMQYLNHEDIKRQATQDEVKQYFIEHKGAYIPQKYCVGEEEQLKKITDALDKVSEQGIRRILYAIIKEYPDKAQFVIDREILKSHKIS